MKYFIDTEFYNNPPKNLELLSIGILSDDDREFYGVMAHAGFIAEQDEWLKKNVYPTLNINYLNTYYSYKDLKEGIENFITGDTIEFWGWFCGFDFTLFSRIFGEFENYPNNWPFYFNDIEQEIHRLNINLEMKDIKSNHNALDDAKQIAKLYYNYIG